MLHYTKSLYQTIHNKDLPLTLATPNILLTW